MTSTKNQKPEKNTDNCTSNLPASQKADTSAEKGKSTLSNLLKEVLASKNNQQQLQKNDRKIDKGKKIGMPPKGTRRSMGKR